MGRMLTVIKDGETLIIDGGRVTIRSRPGKFATLVIDPSPSATIRKVCSPKGSETKQAGG